MTENHIAPTARTRGILDLIAIFKFVKAGALIAAGLGGIGLLNADIEQAAESWLEYLAIGHAPKLLAELAAKLLPQLDAATPRHFIVLAVGAFAYASVFMVEGVGLIKAKRWAEFLTIGVTISFLPLGDVCVGGKANLAAHYHTGAEYLCRCVSHLARTD